MKDFSDFLNSSIPDELLAAYIDGKTTKEENELIENFIKDDSILSEIYEIANNSASIENNFDGDIYDDFREIEFSLKEKYNDLNFKDMSEQTNKRTIGEHVENLHNQAIIQQPDDHSCALRSQQIILRDFGIDIPFEDLEKYALEHTFYSENGTPMFDIGNILQQAGVLVHQIPEATIYDLTHELAQGHRIIVGVDADELWHNDGIKGKLTNWFNDVIGHQGGNHALIVAGVEVDPKYPNNVKVILTDPGSGDLRVEYPFDQFMDAWQDSNCFMVATDNAAPYQYDSETGMEIPSNFAVEQHMNQFVIENSYQLASEQINIPSDYQSFYEDHLSFVGKIPYNVFFDEYVTSYDGSDGSEDIVTLVQDEGHNGWNENQHESVDEIVEDN